MTKANQLYELIKDLKLYAIYLERLEPEVAHILIDAIQAIEDN